MEDLEGILPEPEVIDNGDLPANPQSSTAEGYPCNHGNFAHQVHTGFTKREAIAKDLLQGLLSSEQVRDQDNILISRAWHLTNLLLKKFEEKD